MSKRSCPWSDGTPQRKTCVKEGAFVGELERKAMYERTKALLFSGARTSPLSSATPSALPQRGGVRGGQMRLGPRGDLIRSPANTADYTPSTPLCALCERSLLNATSCGRCEKAVCVQCQRQCSLCLRTYCFTCCQPNYDERHEQLVCIDCQPQ